MYQHPVQPGTDVAGKIVVRSHGEIQNRCRSISPRPDASPTELLIVIPCFGDSPTYRVFECASCCPAQMDCRAEFFLSTISALAALGIGRGNLLIPSQLP